MAVDDAATSIEKAMPIVLLFRDVNEMDDRTDYMFHYIMNELLQKHILVTNNFDDVTWVHLTIVFVNANFVRTHSSYMKQCVEEVRRRNMLLTAVVYENYDCVKLVSDTFKVSFRFFKDKSPSYFDFGDVDPAEKEELTKLVVIFFRAMRIDYRKIPFSKDKNSIQDTLKRLITKVITRLNPYNIDFTGVPLNILSELVLMCDELDHRRKPYDPFYESFLVLLEFQQCEDDSCTLDKTSILQLIYSLNKIRNREEFYLYLNMLMPPPDVNGKRPSFSSVFYETIKTQTLHHSGCVSSFPTFIIVDDFASFLEDGEDPMEMLADSVREFGLRSVIITICSYPINIRVDIGKGDVQRSHGICALPNARLKWNSIFVSTFNKLVFSNSHMKVVGTEEDKEEVKRRRKFIQRPLENSEAPK